MNRSENTEFVLNQLLSKKEKTMTQTNEELREKIHNLLGEHNIVFSQNFIDDLYALIPQPEQAKEIIQGDFEESCPHCKKAIYVLPRRVKQIEVEIVQNQIVGARTILYKIVCVGNFNIDFLDKFYSKQEALDFCKRFNLKVVNEEKE